MNTTCPICACMSCPQKLYCSRKPQPLEQFLPCPACGCLGTWRFSLTANPMQTTEGKFFHPSYKSSIQEGEEKRQMSIDLSKYHSGESKEPKFKRFDALAKKHMPKNGKPVSISILEEPREVSNDYGNSLVMNVKLGTKTLAMWLKEESVILGQTIQALGKNTKRWKGKKLSLYLAKEKYVNVKV